MVVKPLQLANMPVMYQTLTVSQPEMNDELGDVKTVIIRIRRVNFMDQSGAYAMETAIKDLQTMGVRVLMTIIRPQPNYLMHKMHLIPTVLPEEQTFDTFEACVDYLKNHQ